MKRVQFLRMPIGIKNIAVAVLFVVALTLLSFVYLLNTLPPLTNIESRVTSRSTEIYDRSGTVLLYSIGEQPRVFVSLDKIPKKVINATLAAEDDEFYHHSAISIKAMVRSLFLNISRGGMYYGGSTISQQLAKNLFLRPEKTLQRKLREIILAFELERRYSKDQILELYLNSIPYGSGAYGIGTAARLFFGKELDALSLRETVMLVALPRSPSFYSPYGPNRDKLEERADWIIDRMNGLGFIEKVDAGQARKEKVRFLPFSRGIIAPHFVMFIRSILEERYGKDTLEKEGLRVITTLDLNLQQIAETAVIEGAERNTGLYKGKNAALVSLDTKTGEILAMVGSKDFFDESIDGQYNIITAQRQPGSAFKVFSYLTLFKKGYGPQTVLFDLPTEFAPNNPFCPSLVDFENENEECYHPQNFNKRFQGPVTIREALAQSINLPSVKVMYLAGLQETIETAEAFGLTTLSNALDYGLSLGLGAAPARPLEMARAFAVFANDGLLPSVSGILEVKNTSGKVLEKYAPTLQKVIEPQYTRLINDILSDDNARTPLFGRNSLMNIPGHTSAVKTGTSQKFRDAWAIGYTPSIVTAVWAGNNDETPMETSGGILAAVPIWNKFMTAALADKPDEEFTPPEPVASVDKPMLNGSFIYERDGKNEAHSILYFVDRRSPLGPAPINPEIEPQFKNWEAPVQLWWEINKNRFTTPG